MTVKRLLVLSMLIGFGAIATASADEAWDGFTARMSALDATTVLSEQLAAVIEQGDERGLSTLAADVRDEMDERHLLLVEEGFGAASDPAVGEDEYFDHLVEQVAGLDIFADGAETRAALESMGTCAWAGTYLRSLVLQVAEGKPHRIENDRIFIDGTTSDGYFALHQARCRLIQRSDWQPAAIGYHPAACNPARETECPEIADR